TLSLHDALPIFIRADVDVVVEERYGLASRVDDLDAGMLAKGHRPIHVVAAARHVDGQRDVVLPFAESHPEEVGDGHLDGGLRLAIPETADDKLSLDLSVVSRCDGDPPPPNHARALMIDEREGLAWRNGAPIVVAACRIDRGIMDEVAFTGTIEIAEGTSGVDLTGGRTNRQRQNQD